MKTGRHRIGPPGSSVVVKTYREGLASKAGHDLVIEVGRWRAVVEIADDPADWSIELSADPDSLEVREGVGGVKPLSDGDREEILENIDKKVLRGEPIEFRSSAIRPTSDGERLAVEGELTIAGHSRPLSAELDLGADGHIRATIGLTQSDWKIKPYSGLMGALKVRDQVEVLVDAQLPGVGTRPPA